MGAPRQLCRRPLNRTEGVVGGEEYEVEVTAEGKVLEVETD
jgi:hypothetical protein